MNVTSVNNLLDYSKYAVGETNASDNRNSAFDSILQAAVDNIKQTNDYTNAAKEAETSYALGLGTSDTDLLVAQQKANMSLQYTVALRNGVLEAYKEIINLQF
jgi:flagellar hook-basal body complex protein FliE